MWTLAALRLGSNIGEKNCRCSMKIVVSTTTFPARPDDPVPAFVLEQISGLLAEDPSLEVYVLVPHSSYDGPLPSRTYRDGFTEVRYHYFWPRKLESLTGRGILPALRENPARYLLIPFFLLAQRRALASLCREIHPHLIYAHWFTPQAILAYSVSRRFGIPFVFTTHASDVAVLRSLPLAKRVIRRVLQHASAYTAVSNQTARKLLDFFDETEWRESFAHKLTILPMGTSSEMGMLDDHAIRRALAECGVDGSRRIILALGRLVEKKGFDVLIEAYSMLSNDVRRELQLVIAGDGQLMGQLADQAAHLELSGDITFTGYVGGESKHALLQASELFVLPSIIDSMGDSEGLPVTLMEALAFGKVVIATDVSGAQEILDGRCGAIVPEKDPIAIAEAIIRYVNAERDVIACEAAEARRLAADFDWATISRKYLSLLRSAAGVRCR